LISLFGPVPIGNDPSPKAFEGDGFVFQPAGDGDTMKVARGQELLEGLDNGI